MNNKTYLFVDGGHLREYFGEAMKDWVSGTVDFDFAKIKQYFKAEKAFYYDCVRGNDAQDETRVGNAGELTSPKIDSIRGVDGSHVRLGSLSGATGKKRQKEVDVLLAVEMLEHAYRGNMSNAILLSGDKDFRPLVESLVRLGLHIQVAGDQRHLSQDLVLAADSATKLKFSIYHQWLPFELAKAAPLNFFWTTNLPSGGFSNYQSIRFDFLKKGTLRGEEVRVYFDRKGTFHILSPNGFGEHVYNTGNLDRFLTYLGLEFKSLIWEE